MVKFKNKSYKQLCKELKELQLERKKILDEEELNSINEEINEIINQMKTLKDLSYGYKESDLKDVFNDLTIEEKRELDKSLSKQFKACDKVSEYIDIAADKIKESEEENETVEISDSLINKIRGLKYKVFKRAIIGAGLIASVAGGLTFCSLNKKQDSTPETNYTDMNQFSDDTLEDDYNNEDITTESSWNINFEGLRSHVGENKEEDEIQNTSSNNGYNNYSDNIVNEETIIEANELPADSQEPIYDVDNEEPTYDNNNDNENNNENNNDNTTEEENTVIVIEEPVPEIDPNIPIDETPAVDEDVTYYDENGNEVDRNSVEIIPNSEPTKIEEPSTNIVEETEEDVTYYDDNGNEISREQAEKEKEELLNQYKQLQTELEQAKLEQINQEEKVSQLVLK